MRCPWCRNPVSVRGNQWECHSCGNRGRVDPGQVETDRNPGLPLDLLETWEEMKSGLLQLLPVEESRMVPRLGAVLLHEITRAIQLSGTDLTEQMQTQLQAFLDLVADMPSAPSLEGILTAVHFHAVLYIAEGKLTQDSCGIFWKRVMKRCPQENLPEQLTPFFEALGRVSGYYSSGGSQDRSRELQKAFTVHWNRHRFFEPDIDAATFRLRNDDVSRFADDCRDILVFHFPELFRNYRPEEMETLCWESFLRNTLYSDPITAISMWQALLDAAGPNLLENRNVRTLLWNASLFPMEKWYRYTMLSEQEKRK